MPPPPSTPIIPDGSRITRSTSRGAPGKAAPLKLPDLLDRLSNFEGPADQFLQELLAGQCQIAGATAGAVLRASGKPNTPPRTEQNAQDTQALPPVVEVMAATPPLDRDEKGEPKNKPFWLTSAIESTPRIYAQAITLVTPLRTPDEIYEDRPRRYLVMLPLLGRGRASESSATPGSGPDVRGAAAFVIESTDIAAVNAASQRLELTTGLLRMYELRLTLQQRRDDLKRLGKSLEALDAISEFDTLGAATIAMCNHVAALWRCERVSLGFVEGRYVKCRGISHTEKFSRKMKLVQAIEMAMEECSDQDLEILQPAPPQTTYVVRAAAELARRYGAETVISLPLRREGKVFAVLTLERAADKPMSLDDLEALRLACEICTPRLKDLHEHGRWIGIRAARGVRRSFETLVGPKHTWVKIAAISSVAVVLFLIVARGEYRVDAPFVTLAPQKRVVPAPFDGYMLNVAVEPGDRVEAGKTVLAELDTAQLQLKLASALAELARYQKQASLALRDNNTVEVQMAKAQERQTQAQIDLFEDDIRRAQLVAPIDGVVLSGDWSQQLGAPVQAGNLLFEVAPLHGIRADLAVPEDRVADLKVDMTGSLAAASNPADRLRIQVERIHPIAEIVDQQNIFKVRVRLLDSEPWLRPGMEGVAKIDAGTRPYAWIWTRSIINWIRMRWWL